MKRKKMHCAKKLVLHKATLAALNEAKQDGIWGGDSLNAGYQSAVVTCACPTMGLGKELSRCCPVYVPSVNVACIS